MVAAVAALNHLQHTAEQITRHRHLSHLKHRVVGMCDDLGADLDHLLPQRGQRPLLDLPRQSERAQEVGQVIE